MSFADEVDAASAKPTETLSDLELAEEMQRRGWIVHKDDPVVDRHVEIDAPKRGTVRFGVVSDTHLGSKYQQLTYWRRFCDTAREWGAQFMLHAGDAVDGTHKMHRGMEFEQFVHGFEGQGRYAVDKWPELLNKRGKALPQYAIGGNHDGSFFSDVGANVLQLIADNRDDVEFLGAPAATFHIGGLQIYMLHPDGGPSYARSYRLQKIVEQLPADTKPHVLMAGHWHVTSHVPGYRSVEAFALPCFQSQTPYLRRKGLAPVIGGALFEMEYSERGLEDLTTKWVLYRSHLERDW